MHYTFYEDIRNYRLAALEFEKVQAEREMRDIDVRVAENKDVKARTQEQLSALSCAPVSDA